MVDPWRFESSLAHHAHSTAGRVIKEGLRLGDFELHWLNGGSFELDGGAMFGVVPKLLWSKRYPCSDDNLLPLAALPLLVRTPESVLLIDTGLGNKLDDRERRIFRYKGDWNLPGELDQLGLGREDVDFVILTHFDFDHAGGVVMRDDGGGLTLTFPRARHLLQRTEWEDVLSPDSRTVKSYRPVNYELLKGSGRLDLVTGGFEVARGVHLIHTGGHSRGHQAVRLESRGETALHLGDLLPTHAHLNPLWITAYDNFPLDAVRRKEELMTRGVSEGAWFTLYHDPFVQALRLDREGNVVQEWRGR